MGHDSVYWVTLITYTIILVIHIILFQQYKRSDKLSDNQKLYSYVTYLYLFNILYMIYYNTNIIPTFYKFFKFSFKLLDPSTSTSTLIINVIVLETVLSFVNDWIVDNYSEKEFRNILVYIILAKILVYIYIIYSIYFNRTGGGKGSLKKKITKILGNLDPEKLSEFNEYVSTTQSIDLLNDKKFKDIKELLSDKSIEIDKLEQELKIIDDQIIQSNTDKNDYYSLQDSLNERAKIISKIENNIELNQSKLNAKLNLPMNKEIKKRLKEYVINLNKILKKNNTDSLRDLDSRMRILKVHSDEELNIIQNLLDIHPQ